MPQPPAPRNRWWAPRLWAGHLLMVAAVLVASGLGVWQWHAWEAKRADAASDLTDAAPQPLADVFGSDDPFPGDRVGQPVEVSGSWLPAATLYVTGREHDGVDGVWVVTPLAIGDAPDAPALLVVRGWAPSRAAGEAATLPTGPAEVTGWLQPPEGATELPDDDTSDDVLPQLRVADALQYVDRDLYGGYVVLDPARAGFDAAAAGLQPADLEQRPESGRFTAVRNLLYAIEWWVFGAFALFMWWRWLRDSLADPTELADPAETF